MTRQPASGEVSTTPLPPPSPPRLLIVTADLPRAATIAQLIRECGLELVIADNPRRAREAAEDLQADVILVDEALVPNVRAEGATAVEDVFASLPVLCFRADGELLPLPGSPNAANHVLPLARDALYRQMSLLARMSRAERALAQARRAAARADEETYDLVFDLDPFGVVVAANRAACTATGRGSETLEGRHFAEIVADTAGDTWQQIRTSLNDAPTGISVKIELSAADASQSVFADGLCMRREDGTIRLILRNVTETHRLQEQLLRTQRLESIGTLAGGIAHDLNNVLSPVLLCVGLARSCSTEFERSRFLGVIEHSAMRGSELVKQILAFARGMEGERMPVHPKHFVREIVSILRETFPKTIRVVYDLPNELGMVIADTTQLQQVLLNLCVNARDAMPHGGTISLSGRNIHLADDEAEHHEGATAGDHIVLTVADTGTGIQESIRHQIFDAFFTTKPPGRGTGLGLATVQSIVRAHGGFITFNSQPGVGTAFHVHLPTQPFEQAAAREEPKEPAPSGQRELVLVVDDEQHVRNTVERILVDAGYRVATAADGIEAVGRFMTFENEIKVLVTDLLMPRLDGPALIRAVRTSYPCVAIVAMSGNPPDDIAVDPEGAGIGRLIDKPFAAEELLHAIHSVLVTSRNGEADGPSSLNHA